jgi:hypothetical protein
MGLRYGFQDQDRVWDLTAKPLSDDSAAKPTRLHRGYGALCYLCYILQQIARWFILSFDRALSIEQKFAVDDVVVVGVVVVAHT